MKPMGQTPEASKREEGLRALASMIAEAYRRDVVAGIVPASGPEKLKNDTIPESAIVKSIERGEPGEGLIYSETVPIEYFLRSHKKGNNEYCNRILQGGLNVTDKRNNR
jgi:hypothetical protein